MDKLKRFNLTLPVRDDGSLDIDFMVAAVHAQAYWWFLAPRFESWSARASARATSGERRIAVADDDEAPEPLIAVS